MQLLEFIPAEGDFQDIAICWYISTLYTGKQGRQAVLTTVLLTTQLLTENRLC